MITTNKGRRGGRREGAGRKPTGRSKITVTFSLSPEVVAILRSRGRKQSSYIEQLVLADAKR